MIALEADEVSVTQKSQPLKPVWPSDSLAGVPDHSPIPMADSVIESVSTVQHTAKQVQRTADGMLRHSVYGLFDRMPRRPVQRVRVTPIAVQRERQRRVASAIVGLLLVLTVVGASLWYLAGTRHELNIDKQQRAQAAYLQAETDEAAVQGNGRDLVIKRSRDGKDVPGGCVQELAGRQGQRLHQRRRWTPSAPRSSAGSTACSTSTSSPRRSSSRSGATI